MKRKTSASKRRPRTIRAVVERLRRRWDDPNPVEIRHVLRALRDEGTRVEIQLNSSRTIAGTIVHADEIVGVQDRKHGYVVFPVSAVCIVLREPKKR